MGAYILQVSKLQAVLAAERKAHAGALGEEVCQSQRCLQCLSNPNSADCKLKHTCCFTVADCLMMHPATCCNGLAR